MHIVDRLLAFNSSCLSVSFVLVLVNRLQGLPLLLGVQDCSVAGGRWFVFMLASAASRGKLTAHGAMTEADARGLVVYRFV